MSNTATIECRECEGTGEGFGRPCGGCRGRGERVVPVEHDDSLCAMEAELEAQARTAASDVSAVPWERSYEPPAEPALIRLPLVRRAVESLAFEGARVGADDTETAWSLAVAWAAQSVFESSYVRAAWKALALALLVGDEAAALDAAAWIATPGAAMARALARVQSQGVAA